MTPSPRLEKVFYGWRVVAACFVVAAFSWGLGLFGSSVYLHAVTAARGWSIAQVSWAITLFFLVSSSIQRPVGHSIVMHGPRPIFLVGVVCMVTAVAMIGYIDRPWQLYPCFILLGMGWATLSTTGISAAVTPWFERHQGRSITLAITGASFGAIIGVPALLYVIRWLGLGGGLMAAAIASAATLLPLITVVLRHRSPAELGLQRDGAPFKAGGALEGIPATDKHRRRLLWSSTTAFSLALTIQIGFISHHVAIAEPILGSVGAGWLVSATGAVAFVGRLYLARIVDHSPVRRLASQALITQFVAMLAIGLSSTAPVLIIASLAYGFAIGHVTTLSPVVVRRELGAEAFGAAYGTAATVIQFTSAFGPALIGHLRETFGSYPPVFLICAAATALACASLYLGGEAQRAPSRLV